MILCNVRGTLYFSIQRILYAIPCSYLFLPICVVVGLDIQDEMGRHEVGHIDNSMKIPLNNGDGCRFEGHFSINKVSVNSSWWVFEGSGAISTTKA